MRALALLALIALPGVALPQSLGEAARREAERRKKAQDESRPDAPVIDDQALAKASATREKDKDATDVRGAEPHANRPGPATASELDRERTERARDEKMWRERFVSANARLEKARALYDAVKETALAPGQALVDSSGHVVARSPAHLQRLVADAKAELDAAEKGLDELTESASDVGLDVGNEVGEAGAVAHAHEHVQVVGGEGVAEEVDGKDVGGAGEDAADDAVHLGLGS